VVWTFILLGSGRSTPRRRRKADELADHERWNCPFTCGKFYRNTSTLSIQKHKTICPNKAYMESLSVLSPHHNHNHNHNHNTTTGASPFAINSGATGSTGSGGVGVTATGGGSPRSASSPNVTTSLSHLQSLSSSSGMC
jgi:hypothetical protein